MDLSIDDRQSKYLDYLENQQLKLSSKMTEDFLYF